ncbi:MAG: hypothetical protein PHY09_12545 [Desulfuromonadaceae bacterium]|nr:hypothetical protein [Desulfuromonadaceae bacterium]MDD5107391.1 hypothetical protein [Desulfuromonadaceae bacterium]
MQINSTTTETSALTLKPANVAVQTDQQTKDVGVSSYLSLNKPGKLDAVDINNPDKMSSDKNQPQDAIDNQKQPERAISHVIETYNQYGDVRTKFVDSKNNVIYQIPSEMVAKMEDLLGKSDNTTNVKG